MKRGSTIFLQIVIVLIGIGALALLLWEPQIEGRNINSTLYQIYFNDPFLAFVYIGSIPFFAALYQTFKLLRYVRKNKIFSQAAIKTLRTIKYCALVIIGFIVIEEIFILLNYGSDDPAGGVFIGALIAFGSIISAAAATIFEGLLQNAIDIKKVDHRAGSVHPQ